MRYLDDGHITALGNDWGQIVLAVRRAVEALHSGDYAQPVKPYLRYRDLTNRIIAMPAYVGGEVQLSGLKWIASFPRNLDAGLPRAHSVTVLNDAGTGVPVAVLNSARISGIRTAGVTALMTQLALPKRAGRLRFGMTGFGPIGKLHLEMMFSLFGDRIERFRIFDLRGVAAAAIPAALRERVEIVGSWQEAFESDVFVTCTVSSEPYVDRAPVPGSLQLNVSLRDYHSSFLKHVRHVVVDDWVEVCRENTDIHRMHDECGLTASDTLSLADVVVSQRLEGRAADDVVMFNPMGMAVFDVAVAAHYLGLANARSVGVDLKRAE